MAIRSETVREIRERADIVEVIGRRVSLQARGKRFLGLCPFHSEKTPSFSVSREKGLYYCFGCHASGDVFTFVKEIEGLDFPSAVRSVAREVGIELEAESSEEAAKRKRLHAVARTNDYAHAYFETELWGENGARARDYLRERGIPERQARARRLGFGGLPGGLSAYLEAKNVPNRLQAEAGLLSDNGRVLFEERLLFPIRDAQERTVGFGGRRLGEGPGPKYINTREGPLFSKRGLLYGWDVARETIRREKRAVLVEGYTDVLALQRASVNEAVASLGTAFTDEHAKLLARFAEEVIVVLDGDHAGEAASREASERLLRAELKVTVVTLPSGEDPDTFVRSRSVDDVRRSFENRRAALEVFVERAFEGQDNSIEARVEAAASLAPLFFAMPRGLQRDLYQARLAERVGVTVEQLERHLRRNAPRPDRKSQNAASVAPPPVDETSGQALEPLWGSRDVSMLRELLLYPKLRSRFAELAEYAPQRLSRVLEVLARDEGSTRELLERLIADPKALVRLNAVEPYGGDDHDDRAERTFSDVLSTLKSQYLDATRHYAIQALDEAIARGEDTRDLERQIKDLTRTVRRLKRADHQRSW